MATPILNDRQFGILIAYVIPGFVVIDGLAHHVPSISDWMSPGEQPSVAGFLYVTLASVGCGLVISTLRWLLIDSLFHRTGIQKARWSMIALREQLPAFEMFVLYTYRYYQFYANLSVALPTWVALTLIHNNVIETNQLFFLCLVEVVLLAGARDTLRKYYDRTNELLRQPPTPGTIIIP